MEVKVECRGDRIADAADTLSQVLQTLLARIIERDRDLDLSALQRITVAEDYARALLEETGDESATGVVRAIHGEEAVGLLIDGAHMSAALAGDAEQVSSFVHLFHRELCRIHDARARLGQSSSLELLLECEFDRQLLPIAESMWAEYFSTRRSVWSLPQGSDLMLTHLADLLEALPAAMNEEIVLHLGSNDIDGLFLRSVGRVAHLAQTMAHCQGYLAGLGRPLADIGPEYDALVARSPLAAPWGPLLHRFEVLFASPSRSTESIYLALQTDVVAVFAALGLRIRRAEDGGVWVDALPIVAGGPTQ
ncbi:MAG: hypothetical protein KDG55_00960 [Rhodocyclaceae bacterium]|nr:hypothetical protein [Rhodocyclaceae bacterium]